MHVEPQTTRRQAIQAYASGTSRWTVVSIFSSSLPLTPKKKKEHILRYHRRVSENVLLEEEQSEVLEEHHLQIPRKMMAEVRSKPWKH